MALFHIIKFTLIYTLNIKNTTPEYTGCLWKFKIMSSQIILNDVCIFYNAFFKIYFDVKKS